MKFGKENEPQKERTPQRKTEMTKHTKGKHTREKHAKNKRKNDIRTEKNRERERQRTPTRTEQRTNETKQLRYKRPGKTRTCQRERMADNTDAKTNIKTETTENNNTHTHTHTDDKKKQLKNLNKQLHEENGITTETKHERNTQRKGRRNDDNTPERNVATGGT